MRRHLARQLGRLSPERRSVLVLRLVHGYAVDEIAELTGAPLNTVRDRLARGRRQLRGMLEKDPAFAGWVTRDSHD
jgi:RNA polymerase sigma-70 factor (ECF subfamily)